MSSISDCMQKESKERSEESKKSKKDYKDSKNIANILESRLNDDIIFLVNSFLPNEIQWLDIIMFINENCKYSQNMYEVLLKENVLEYLSKIVVISIGEGREISKSYGINGTPSFISLKTKRGTRGCREKFENVLSELRSP
jgi:hypothetical protein